MKLLTIGDSFTFGEELEDRANSWPQLLANSLTYDLVNLGEPANNNTGMARQLLNYFATNEKPDLVVIGWSSPGRMEFSDDGGNFSVWPGSQPRLVFRQNWPWRDELRQYITLHQNSEYLYAKYLQDIIFVQSFLENQAVRYIMIATVGNEYYKTTFGSKYKHYNKLINDKQFLGWPRAGMSEWTNGCKKGPGGHFLDAGHKNVADKLYEHIGNLGWLP